MNTNGNTYTIIYTTIIVVLVAAILAFASMSLKSRQEANVKAETISQMLTAAHFYTKDECSAMGNDKVLEAYSSNIKSAFAINASGQKVRDLNTDVKNIELIDNLKAQDKNIRNGKEVELPVYIFSKDGKDVTVVPCYGAGLWGPVWGYLAFEQDDKTFVGAYFDHESETPGLGAKIKDDPDFRAEFVGKVADYSADPIFEIVKGGAPEGQQNAVDAITGATMTSKGLSKAIDTWLEAYKPYLSTNGAVTTTTPTPAQPASSSAAAPADSANIN
jgi:Na+-transporting NADH:ubiquinone oxidoreductase subunit C